MDKAYNEIVFYNDQSPDLDEINMNAISHGLSVVDDRVIQLKGDLTELIKSNTNWYYDFKNLAISGSTAEETYSDKNLLSALVKVYTGESFTVPDGFEFRTARYDEGGNYIGMLHNWTNTFTYNSNMHIKINIRKTDRATIYPRETKDLFTSTISFPLSYDTSKDINTYKYKMFSFTTEDRRLITVGSVDGIRWETISTTSHIPDVGTCLRDPSVIRVNDVYYMIYSRILNDTPSSIQYPTDKYIGLAKSYDLKTWTNLQHIEFAGYHNMWAPEFYKRKDGGWGIVFSCVKDDETRFEAYTFDITSFEPFEYGNLNKLTFSTGAEVFDLDLKNIKGEYYMMYSIGLNLRMAKEVDGVFQQYQFNAPWYNKQAEGAFLLEMDGFYRLYLSDHTVVPNTVSYTDSNDLINWSELTYCDYPMTGLQQATLIYEDEWINHKINMLTPNI